MHASLRDSCCRFGTPISRLARRCASTVNNSANPYPYPSHSNPTPHQIFHLPFNASQKEVKSRYYELVRVYHPDTPIARAYPPEISEARFHAISTSYNVLRGRHAPYDPDRPDASPHPRVDLHAVWRAKQRHRQDPMEPVDDKWKDRIILGSLVLTLGVFVYQISESRQRTVEEVLQYSGRSRAKQAGLQQASTLSNDVRLLTAPDSPHSDSHR